MSKNMNIPAILALSIPIIAILGGYYVKIKQMEINKKEVSDKDLDILKQVSKENEALKQRVENLEQIITSLDKDLLALKPHNNNDDLAKQVAELVKKLKD
jgi:flagellar biosynthesis component FlhA